MKLLSTTLKADNSVAVKLFLCNIVFYLCIYKTYIEQFTYRMANYQEDMIGSSSSDEDYEDDSMRGTSPSSGYDGGSDEEDSDVEITSVRDFAGRLMLSMANGHVVSSL